MTCSALLGTATSIRIILPIAICFFGQSFASPTGSKPIPQHNVAITSRSSNDGPDCGFDGDSDMYGLGIRLGVYLQAAGTVIAQIFNQDSASDLVITGALFQFAMLISVVYNTANNEELYAVEALVVYLFGLASLGISSDALWNRPAHKNYLERHFLPSATAILRQMTVLGIDCYQVWFWFTGLDTLKRTPCQAHTFFFARVDMYGRFRTFAKVFSVVLLTFITVIVILMIMRSVSEKRKEQGKSTASRDPVALLKIQPGPYNNAFPLIFFLAMIIFAVEFTIAWNNIQGVNSVDGVGQLIPLIIAVGTCMGVLLNWSPQASKES